MIFVTVGTQRGFDRLVKKMDEIATTIGEEIIIQTGHSTYQPQHARYFSFLDNYEDIIRLNKEARLVVSHAGVGSILTALKQKKPLIVVPRMKKYNEHFDDHQLELVNALSDKKMVKVIYEIDELESSLMANFDDNTYSHENELVESIKSYIKSIG